MSKEHSASAGSRRQRASASPMSRPTTNSPPMIFMARRSACRTMGSLARCVRPRSQPPVSPLCS
jgi:hypothetical protein